MLRPYEHEVEGIDLHRFEVGQTYDVPTSLATFLIVVKCAEPVVEEAPTVHPKPNLAAREEKVFRGEWPGWAVAADWLRRK